MAEPCEGAEDGADDTGAEARAWVLAPDGAGSILEAEPADNKAWAHTGDTAADRALADTADKPAEAECKPELGYKRQARNIRQQQDSESQASSSSSSPFLFLFYIKSQHHLKPSPQNIFYPP